MTRTRDSDSPLPDEERIEKEAAFWLARFDRGFTAEEQDAFFEWLAKDPRHGEVFAEDQEQWREFDLLDEWRPRFSTEANPDLLKKEFVKSKRKSFHLCMGLAAVILVGCLLTALTRTEKPTRSGDLAEGAFAQSYERHVLEDGSIVELNAGAQAAVRYEETLRRVELLAGEAHFSVAQNPDRPFVVGTQGAEVRAIGTAFSVRLTSESIEVLVTEGKVRMDKPFRRDPGNTIPPPTEPPTVLIAGQRAVQPLVQQEFKPQVYTITVSEIESRLSWKDQILDYDSRPLREVVDEFNRHNYTQILISDAELEDLKVTIALKPDNYQGFVKLLELSAEVDADETDYGTIVLRKRH